MDFSLCLSFLTLFTFVSNCITTNVEFNTESWPSMLEGEWMVKFYAPWCPACRSLEGTWKELDEWAVKDDVISLGGVDVTAQPGLNGRFMITALPTIYHVKDGVFRQYKGSRSLDELKLFIKDEQWKDLSPISEWLSPTSYVMTGMSKIFDFSMTLKAYHETLHKQYGFPSWVALLLFGLIIILGGLLLGIGLVFVSDYIWPPQPMERYDDAQPPQQMERYDDAAHKKDDDKDIKSDEADEKESTNGSSENEVNEEETSARKRNIKQADE